MTERAIIRRFLASFRPHRKSLSVALALTPLVALCGIAQPWILGHAIDKYMLQGDTGGLQTAALAFFAVIVAEFLFGSLQSYLISAAGIRTVGTLRRDVYQHIMSQGLAFFDQRQTGSLLSRTTTDVDAIGESFIIGVVGIIRDVVKLVGILITMLFLDWKLTLAAFCVVPVIALIVNSFRKVLRDLSVRIRVLVAKLNGFMAEHLAGAEIVQLLNREEKTTQEFDDINRDALQTYHKSNIVDAALYALMDGISGICIACVLWFGGLSVLSGTLSPGLLVTFVEYVQKALIPIKEFSGKYATLQRSIAALERIFGLFDTHKEVPHGSEDAALTSGAVRFESVSFQYPETEAPVLREVSFEVSPGQVVALVGATGSGKSTICRLLSRGYDGYEGQVTIDGTDLRSLNAKSIHSLISVVHQDVTLFQGSVGFNLTLGDPSIGPDRMVAAAQMVQASQFIDSLPGGYDFELTDRGAGLSAGQGQLLSFARAMCRDSAIVILDEATASVDPATEGLIQVAIDRILSTRTVLVVAHRLSTIQAADLILVLDRGKIIERGTHEELLSQNGRYTQLYNHQRAMVGTTPSALSVK